MKQHGLEFFCRDAQQNVQKASKTSDFFSLHIASPLNLIAFSIRLLSRTSK